MPRGIHPNSRKNLIHGFKKGMKTWNKGKKNPWLSKRNRENNPVKNPDVRMKISISKTGKTNKHSKSFKKGQIPWNKGMGDYISGNKNPNWKGGRNNYRKEKDSLEYKKWRMSVYIRDNFTCQGCEKVGGKLEAHHIKSWAKYPELRFVVENGITLCIECHKLTPNYGNKKS